MSGEDVVGVAGATTAVREGESWREAADRLAGGATTALDLSDDLKWFALDDGAVVVRPMNRSDLPDVARWRATEHLRRWWADEGGVDLGAVTEKYGPRIDGESPTRMWIVEIDRRSAGFLQSYRLRDYPDYGLLGPDPEAIGVDYAIAEEYAGRGYGVRALWAWLPSARDHHRQARSVVAAPDHRNAASLRMLAKAGFVEGLWFDQPRTDGGTDTVVDCTLDLSRVVGPALR